MNDYFERAMFDAAKCHNYGAWVVLLLYGGELSGSIVSDFILTYTAGCPPYDVLRNNYESNC